MAQIAIDLTIVWVGAETLSRGKVGLALSGQKDSIVMDLNSTRYLTSMYYANRHVYTWLGFCFNA